MNELVVKIIIEMLPTIISTIMMVLMGVIVTAIKKHIKNSEVRDFIVDVVKFVEQTNKDLHGDEKLAMAELKITEILQSKGIHIDGSELTTLIEAAVYELNREIDSKSGGDE